MRAHGRFAGGSKCDGYLSLIFAEEVEDYPYGHPERIGRGAVNAGDDQRGPHGVGLTPTDQVLSTWADRLADWLKARNWRELPPR